MTYSRSENGGYCAYFSAFASSVRTGGNFGALVETRLVKKAVEILESHENTEYHKNTYTIAVCFLEFKSGKRQSVVVELSTSHAVEIQKNREVLRSIIAMVEFCFIVISFATEVTT